MDHLLRFNSHRLRVRKRNPIKGILLIASIVILLLLIWQVFSAYRLHQRYQVELMDTVSEQVLRDYEAYFSRLRLQIDLFQKRHEQALAALYSAGNEAETSAYMALHSELKEALPHSRLFAFVDNLGKGSLAHITGEFLPSCKLEIASTLASKNQEQLFLHRKDNSIHFDLLQPLQAATNANELFFVSFSTDMLLETLNRFQLPYQELFLLRSDSQGKIELSGVGEEGANQLVMSEDELERFSFVKPIPRTRWQVAIRLDEGYNHRLLRDTIVMAVVAWLILSALMLGFYHLLRIGSERYHRIAELFEFTTQRDALTELVNRAHFEQELEDFIHSKRDKDVGVVLQIDVDHFQLINSSYGYTYGDMLLASFAESLTELLPEGAIVSRLGNDEFAVLLRELRHEESEDFARQLKKSIEELEFKHKEQVIHVTVCIGVVNLIAHQNSSGRSLLSLGQAVNTAKGKGRNRVQMYQSDDSQLVRHAEQMDMIQTVEKALRQHRLVLFRQRIAPLQHENDDDTACYEVLVRMFDPQGNLIPPGRFISVAEQYGMISSIDRWVLEATCQAMSLAPDESARYSVNLSGKTLAMTDLAERARKIFRQYNISPKLISFEITETAAIENFALALDFISEMKAEGCKFYLDDFGSGLSSFAYLQKLPVDVIKIDGSFVREIEQNQVSAALVENIQRMARVTGKRTVAEWVENEGIAEKLRDIGIDYGQGYHIHKPEHWYVVNKSSSDKDGSA